MGLVLEAGTAAEEAQVDRSVTRSYLQLSRRLRDGAVDGVVFLRLSQLLHR